MSVERPCYRHPNRMTAVSCSDCDRPICPDCMVFAPVGIKCPDHAGAPQGLRKARVQVRKQAVRRSVSSVSLVLIAINVVVYLVELALGGTVNGQNNWVYEHGVLIDKAGYVCSDAGDICRIGVGYGDWWRLITSAFLHYGPFHLALNMYSLYAVGPFLEDYLGRGKFLLLYVVSGLAGSAGALVVSPNALTAGASGAIFGLLGLLVVFEYMATRQLNGQFMGLLLINLVFTVFFRSQISLGGHVGGLIGGVAVALLLAQFGKRRAAFGAGNAATVLAGMAGVGVAAVVIAAIAVGKL